MRAFGLTLTSLLLLTATTPAWAQNSALERLPVGLVADAPLAWGMDFLKGCTSSVFRLSDETAKAIEKDGIGAFDTMSSPADSGWSWRYMPWVATPVDSEAQQSWNENGFIWGGLACGLNADWQAKSLHSGTEPGSFYSFGHGVLLLVDPSQNIVIYTQRDTLH